MIRKSLKVFLIGLVTWPIFIEVVGFISPFWGLYINNDFSSGSSRTLLELFQPYVPLVSVVFAYSFILLSRLSEAVYGRWACIFLSMVYVAFSIYGFFPKDSITYIALNSMHYFIELAMLFIGVLLIYKNIPKDA